MVGFQVTITVQGRIVTGDDEALQLLRRYWPGHSGMIYAQDLLECWADGTWIVSLPIDPGAEDTIEQVDIQGVDGVQIHAVRD